jgi:hypothetical protein
MAGSLRVAGASETDVEALLSSLRAAFPGGASDSAAAGKAASLMPQHLRARFTDLAAAISSSSSSSSSAAGSSAATSNSNNNSSGGSGDRERPVAVKESFRFLKNMEAAARPSDCHLITVATLGPCFVCLKAGSSGGRAHFLYGPFGNYRMTEQGEGSTWDSNLHGVVMQNLRRSHSRAGPDGFSLPGEQLGIVMRQSSSCTPPNLLDPSNVDGLLAHDRLVFGEGSKLQMMLQLIASLLQREKVHQELLKLSASMSGPTEDNYMALAHRLTMQGLTAQMAFQFLRAVGVKLFKKLKKNPHTALAWKVRG